MTVQTDTAPELGPVDLPLARLRDPVLRPIAEKVLAGIRLSHADGLASSAIST